MLILLTCITFYSKNLKSLQIGLLFNCKCFLHGLCHVHIFTSRMHMKGTKKLRNLQLYANNERLLPNIITTS